MAIHEETLWEFRTAGSNNYGGGFYDRNPGTSVDYSNQDAVQLTLTDLATDVAGTTLSSVTGGFTAAMAGNIINIASGTGFAPGRYEITAFTDTNTVTIDRSAGSSASAGTGYVGGAMALPTDAILETFVAGNTAYLKNDGTYTLTASILLTKDGLYYKKIKYEGYNTSRGDNPTGTDRPLIACGAFVFYVDDYYSLYNLRATGTGTNVLQGDFETTFFNCKSENSSGTADRTAFLIGGFAGANIVGCEGISDNGYAFKGSSINFYGCYAHDSKYGYELGVSNGAVSSVQNCIADTCTNGISDTNTKGSAIINSTIYNCTTGFNLAILRNTIILNNIIDNCTTGISSGTPSINASLIDHNNYTNNGTDVVNAIKGPNATALAPEFVDAANGDFSVGANMAGIGYSGDANYNFTNVIDLGAVQREAGGGEGTTGFVS